MLILLVCQSHEGLTWSKFDVYLTGADIEDIAMRREQFRCPHFRILVIGRANAGKTTILEKVCGVATGTKPIIVYDKESKFDTKTQITWILIAFY